MTQTITHRVWRLGKDIDTDVLAPGIYMKFGTDVLAKHCLESVRPDFAPTVQIGDVLAAGPNFGIGSSREQAASVLVQLGVYAVIAPSFNGLYFRNAFNVGLLLLTCPQAEEINEGERVEIDIEHGHLTKEDGQTLHCEPVPGFLLDMVKAGGLLQQLKRRYAPPT